MSDPELVAIKDWNERPRRGLNWGWWKWIFALVTVVVILRIVLPVGLVSRPLRGRTACGANINAIARACLIYAEANQGILPPNLDLLLIGGERAHLVSKQMICPVSELPYVYIAHQKNSDDPRNVIVYEPLSEHDGGGGGNVAFLDGSTKWFKPAGHQAVIAETKARLAEAATQPTARTPDLP